MYDINIFNIFILKKLKKSNIYNFTCVIEFNYTLWNKKLPNFYYGCYELIGTILLICKVIFKLQGIS